MAWTNPTAIGSKRDFHVIGNKVTSTGITPVAVAYMAWDHSDVGGFTTRTVTLYHVTSTKTLTVDVYDGTSVIGTITTTASTSGVATFTFTNPGVDKRLEFRVSQGSNGTPRPEVYGIYVTLT